MQNVTPLRYPGGKAALTDLLRQIIELNRFGNRRYVEPFAGGAGAGIGLLLSEAVDGVLLNDLDYRIYCFWHSVIKRPNDLKRLIASTPVNIRQWRKQRQIYRSPLCHTWLHIGFATLYLNRCNRSGIIGNGGPIGGVDQSGKWKIDVRFNKEELQRRIDRIAEYANRIEISRLDALECLQRVNSFEEIRPSFVYLDPPYYRKGPYLYLNALEHDDHVRLAEFLRTKATFPWVMTYDDTPQIRAMYDWCRVTRYSLRYSAQRKGFGSEILISPPTLQLPLQQRSESVRWSIPTRRRLVRSGVPTKRRRA